MLKENEVYVCTICIVLDVLSILYVYLEYENKCIVFRSSGSEYSYRLKNT